MRFDFKGKCGKEHVVELDDRRAGAHRQAVPGDSGQELFQYLDDDGQRHPIESADVNAYLREISGGDFTAKDFRTWNGTVLAMRSLQVCPPAESATAGKRQVAAAIKAVAAELGNTPAVCRKAYVHPVVVNAYLEGRSSPRRRGSRREQPRLSAEDAEAAARPPGRGSPERTCGYDAGHEGRRRLHVPGPAAEGLGAVARSGVAAHVHSGVSSR